MRTRFPTTHRLAVLALLAGACAAGGGGGSTERSPLRPTPDGAPEGTDDSGTLPQSDAGGGAADAASEASAPPPADELCDGYDNDANGVVDDGCTCATGATQTCYPGPVGADVGACTRGTQACATAEGEFHYWGACEGAVMPSLETCGDSIDQDCNGADLACPPAPVCAAGTYRGCYGGPAGTAGVGRCRAGLSWCSSAGTWGGCIGEVRPGTELCGNGVDDDCNGTALACPVCTPGETRTCYTGPPGTVGVGACRAGTQTCVSGTGWSACTGVVEPTSEVCGNSVDEDCNGAVDSCGTTPPPPDDGTVRIDLFLLGDCVTATCPPSAPYPVGCSVLFPWWTDPHGCVASTPTSSTVFFKAGDECDRGLVTGFLDCSPTPGTGLNLMNCPISKPIPMHVSDRRMCPGEL